MLKSILCFLSPDADFAELDSFLSTRGWTREPDRTLANDGQSEPVFVSWSVRDSIDDEIDYTFDSKTGLRMLEVRGENARRWNDELGRTMKVLALSQILDLLQSDRVHDLILGLEIATKLRKDFLVPDIIRLSKYQDANVSRAAQIICNSALQIDIRNPRDVEAAVGQMIDVHQRRQTLRWMMHDFEKANPNIIAAVKTGLNDPDWEVRGTALLAAGRFDIRSLARDVERCQLPRVSRLGPVKIDRDILNGIKMSLLMQFQDKEFPDPPKEANERIMRSIRLRKYVAGRTDKIVDHLTRFIEALTIPLQTGSLPPDKLPSGVRSDGDDFILEGTEIRLCWVEAIEHRLGDDEPNMSFPNPIRNITPNGFFIAEQLLEDDSNAPLICDLQQARHACEQLSTRSGANVGLPSSDEWEMAARGPDGRRFPWGNGFELNWNLRSSPWGCFDMFGVTGQWLDGAEPTIAGSNEVKSCTFRSRVTPDSIFGVRPVVRT